MAYTTAEAQQELLHAIGVAVDELAVALADLGGAHELLDDTTADRLEEALFRPVQLAYGRAKRTHDAFAQRHGLSTRPFTPADPGHPSQGVKGFVDSAVHAAGSADARIIALQDSLVTIDVGDAELREGLSDVRRQLGDLPGRAKRFVSTLGR